MVAAEVVVASVVAAVMVATADGRCTTGPRQLKMHLSLRIPRLTFSRREGVRF